MAIISTETKRAFLRELKWQAEELKAEGKNGYTLYEVIKSFVRARTAAMQSGRNVISTSGDGHDVAFESSNVAALAGRFTPHDIIELGEELITRYANAVAALEISVPETNDDSQDAAILTEMLALLEPNDEQCNDLYDVDLHR